MTITDIGYIAMILALVLSVYGFVVSLYGARRNMPDLIASGRNATYVVGALVLTAAITLWYALLTNQFQIEFIATHSERNLPTFYKISALWGGQAGSLTFWTLLLSGFAVAATWFFREEQPSLRPYVNAVLLGAIFFFVLVVLFAANPFEKLWRVNGQIVAAVFQPAGATLFRPADGQGLNPQLQNYWMVIHPVMLYLGFVGMTVPFAFAVAALASGQLGNTWIRLIRKWTLAPWVFLTIGVIMGSQWAYVELGWGGYWAWDPVENASLLPWLTATAFLHSIMIQERRGMLKVWNVVLIWLTWELTIFGTFLTRSGVIESVHSFALSPIGPMFAVFIVATLAAFLPLLIWRLPLLKSENQLDSVISRETAFLTGNLLFVVIMLATLLGTLFPTISEWVTGNKMSLNAPYFERVNGPIFLVLLILMGAAPLLAWRRSGSETLRRNFLIPIIAALVSLPLLFAFGVRNPAGFVGVGILTFVLAGIIQEYVRGMQARREATREPPATAMVNIVRRNGRRYGGYIVHIGVLLIALGDHRQRVLPVGGPGEPEAGRDDHGRQFQPDLSRPRCDPRAELHGVHGDHGSPPRRDGRRPDLAEETHLRQEPGAADDRSGAARWTARGCVRRVGWLRGQRLHGVPEGVHQSADVVDVGWRGCDPDRRAGGHLAAQVAGRCRGAQPRARGRAAGVID